jgi:hypothetical protein
MRDVVGSKDFAVLVEDVQEGAGPVSSATPKSASLPSGIFSGGVSSQGRMCTVPVLVFSMNSSSSLSGGMRVLAISRSCPSTMPLLSALCAGLGECVGDRCTGVRRLVPLLVEPFQPVEAGADDEVHLGLAVLEDPVGLG